MVWGAHGWLPTPECCADVYCLRVNNEDYKNYCYVIVDRKTKAAAAVDAFDPQALLTAVEENGLDLKYILTTHHHNDHSGGNDSLKESFGGKVPIVGSASTPGGTQVMKDEEKLKLGENLEIEAIHTPGHTMDHISFYVTPTGECDGKTPCVFTGDFLFTAGVGRFFEGTPKDNADSINKFYKRCTLETLMFCGHEYVVSNLKFAQHFEPENEDVRTMLSELEARQKKDEVVSGIPSTLAKELKINPFVRSVRCPKDLKNNYHSDFKEPDALLGFARDMKDKF